MFSVEHRRPAAADMIREIFTNLTSAPIGGEEVRGIPQNIETLGENGDITLSEALGGSGNRPLVTENTAFSLTPVFACIRNISEDTARLRIRLHRRISGEEVEEITDHPALHLLNDEPNDWGMNGHNFRECLISQLVATGNSYAVIRRDNAGRIIALEPQISTASGIIVSAREFSRVHYQAMNIFGESRVYFPGEIAHFRGLTQNGLFGISPIQQHRLAIGEGLAQGELASEFLQNGAKVKDTLTVPGKLNPEVRERMKAQWHAQTTGGQSWRTPILEQGTAYDLHTLNMRDLQFLDSRRFSVEEVCRIFRVPPHKIGDNSRSTFNNIEHQSVEYLTDTLQPWMERFETTLNHSILSAAERSRGLFFSLDESQFLRTDRKSRAEADRIDIESGVVSVNEVRANRALNPADGGDSHRAPMNFQTLNDLNSGRQFTRPNSQNRNEQRANPVAPLVADLLSNLATKEANATRGKSGTEIGVFVDRHRAHLADRFQPLAESVGLEQFPPTVIDQYIEARGLGEAELAPVTAEDLLGWLQMIDLQDFAR